MPDNDGLRSRVAGLPHFTNRDRRNFSLSHVAARVFPVAVLRTYWPLILILVGPEKMWDATQGAKQSPRPFVLSARPFGVSCSSS